MPKFRYLRDVWHEVEAESWLVDKDTNDLFFFNGDINDPKDVVTVRAVRRWDEVEEIG